MPGCAVSSMFLRVGLAYTTGDRIVLKTLKGISSQAGEFRQEATTWVRLGAHQHRPGRRKRSPSQRKPGLPTLMLDEDEGEVGES